MIRKNICLSSASANLPESQWESVLPNVLHNMRTLLCTVNNCTSHERMLSFSRHTANGNQLPTWLRNSGPVLLRRFVRSSKSDPLVDKVELLEVNNSVAWVKYPNGAIDRFCLGFGTFTLHGSLMILYYRLTLYCLFF